MKEVWKTAIINSLSIKSINTVFDNDIHRIVSRNGQELLSDDNRMMELQQKFDEADEKSEELLINLKCR